MKRVLLLSVLVLTVGLSSCQCSNKPDVGPVEGDTVDKESVTVD